MTLIERLSKYQLYVLILVYIFIYSYNLDKYPRIWWDEALFSDPAYTLLTEGRFGTGQLHGWYNIQNNTFIMPPAYLLLLYPSFKIFGFGILQARSVSVLLGLVSLIFAYKLAERLYNKNVAVIASLLLIFNPVNFWIYREVRMEASLIAFLLIAFYLFVTALSDNSKKYYLLSGIFASLGLLSHPNGIHGIAALFLILIIKKIHDSRLWSYVLGALLPVMAYSAYVLSDYNNFRAQTAHISGSAATVLQNVAQEYLRYKGFIDIYGQGFFESGILFYIKLAFFLMLFGMLIMYVMGRRNESDKLIAVLVLTHLVLFTVLVRQKIWWYLGIILPYVNILLASFFVEKTPRKGFFRTFKALVSVFLIVNIMHMSFSLYITRDYDYNDTIAKIKEIIPEDATILGPSELWFGMSEYRFYETAVIPMRMQKENFSGIIKDLNPDYVILDKNFNSTSAYPEEFRKELFGYLNNRSVKIASIPYRSSLASRTPLDVYKINRI